MLQAALAPVSVAEAPYGSDGESPKTAVRPVGRPSVFAVSFLTLFSLVGPHARAVWNEPTENVAVCVNNPPTTYYSDSSS